MNQEWLAQLERKKVKTWTIKISPSFKRYLKRIEDFESRSTTAFTQVIGGPNCPCCRKYLTPAKGETNE
jgi:hypothetical protein